MFPYKPVVYQLKEGDLIEEGGPVIGAEPRVEHIQSGGHQDVSQSEGSQKHSQVSPQNHGGQYCVNLQKSIINCKAENFAFKVFLSKIINTCLLNTVYIPVLVIYYFIPIVIVFTTIMRFIVSKLKLTFFVLC